MCFAFNHKKLEQFSQELEKSNNNKAQLFKIVSHDLRGPISNIGNAMFLLKQFAAEKDYESIIETCELLEAQSKSTHDTMENLLQWSQSQSEALQAKLKRGNLKQNIDRNKNGNDISIRNVIFSMKHQ